MTILEIQNTDPSLNITILTGLIAGLAAFFAGVYIEKYKKRIVYLKYKETYQQIAFSTIDNYWGNITVIHNGQTINYLFICKLEIKNSSTSDVDSYCLDVNFDNNSTILNQSATHLETNKTILFEKGYDDFFKKVLSENNDDLAYKSNNPEHVTPQSTLNELDYILKNRSFYIPVLNRKDTISITFLVESSNGTIPKMYPSITKKSIKLILAEDEEKEAEKQKNYVLYGSLIIYIIGYIFLFLYFPQSKQILIYSFIVGSINGIIAFLIFWMFKLIRRLVND